MMTWALIVAIAQFGLSSLIGLGLWLFATGRYTQRQQDGQLNDSTRISALEAGQADEHELRRDMNRDLGRLDVRLSQAEVRIEDNGRRLSRLENGGGA